MIRNTKILTIVIAVLVVFAGVSLFINKEKVAENKKLNEDAVFIIKDEDEEISQYTINEIIEIGSETFTATLDTSSAEPKNFEYTGVLLKDIFTDAGIDIVGKEVVTVTAADGYTVAVSMDKFLEDDNVYLAYMKEGVPIGSREEGGKGPYQMIISKDKFSQFWCNYALEADIK